tara:strand:+ start:54176 stop:54382 length:207 start_codon:yes stop_codon:yes gene_type:complete
MEFKVTEIKFDFDDAMTDESITNEYKREVTDETIGHIWNADDGEDLIEEITTVTGWCINSIDFYHILR